MHTRFHHGGIDDHHVYPDDNLVSAGYTDELVDLEHDYFFRGATFVHVGTYDRYSATLRSVFVRSCDKPWDHTRFHHATANDGRPVVVVHRRR